MYSLVPSALSSLCSALSPPSLRLILRSICPSDLRAQMIDARRSGPAAANTRPRRLVSSSGRRLTSIDYRVYLALVSRADSDRRVHQLIIESI